ncbi:MAG: tetratricopeptide repeat protein [Deltaproteobacteria bacterium]|nr:tetratricopeptide repeat protein [Deltaproteobacteria bacterium]
MPTGYRVGIDPIPQVVLMENHDQAYHIWKEFNFQNRILVHIDPHLDFKWIVEQKPESILNVATRQQVDHLLRCQTVWNFTSQSVMEKIHIGNFLYPAFKEKRVREFYWVLPDGMMATSKDKKRVFRWFARLRDGFPQRVLNLSIHKEGVFCRLDGVPTWACSLSNLPRFSEPVLLDIDTDFFVFREWNSAYPFFNPDDIRVWMQPAELVRRLKEKGITTDCVTIAYSVEGGYTPPACHDLGNTLASLFGGGTRREMENKSSHPAFNNHGRVYQWIGEWKKSRQVLEDSLKKDPDNPHTLCDLGHCFAKDKLWKKAASYYQEALIRMPTLEAALYHLALMQVRQGCYKEAIASMEKEDQKPTDFKVDMELLKAKLYRKTGQWERAVRCYENLLREGYSDWEIQFYLGCLYARQRRFYKMGRRFRDAFREGLGLLQVVTLKRVQRGWEDWRDHVFS